MKKILKKEVVGIQPVFSTNVENTGNYISDGNIINKNCLVDCDYEGEVNINLVNNGNKEQCINAGDKIIQGVVIPVNFVMPEEVENEDILYKGSHSKRGEGGFGSTGTK